MSLGYMSYIGGMCSWGKCPGGICPRGKCTGGKCPKF